MIEATGVSEFVKLGLTRREADVLFWIARGQTNTEIGASLSISPLTVKKHLERVFRKLGVKTRLAAAVLAMEAISASSRARSKNPVAPRLSSNTEPPRRPAAIRTQRLDETVRKCLSGNTPEGVLRKANQTDTQ